MEAELAALAASGATTLVGLMVSETWTQARERVARFFARGGDGETAERELSVAQGELVAARGAQDEAAVADIEAEWRVRLRRALEADPAAAEDLRSLLAELAPEGGGAPAATVRNSVSGGTQYGPVFQGQQITLSGLTFHSSAPRAPEGDAEGS
ncbi:hypothetical protein [Streptomyces sp. DH24]|uniref:hypothetical protein n=1 Tax=Streptomyces sp. DH24 TaxID=3040123 RepID=UPI002441769E|nr:hypothetical protein [Streptomyces sp. DH24]MDG9716406.1 hypothetical protein [Streptomyces sp. DH24]